MNLHETNLILREMKMCVDEVNANPHLAKWQRLKLVRVLDLIEILTEDVAFAPPPDQSLCDILGVNPQVNA